MAENPNRPPDNRPYIAALVIMTAVGITAALLITFMLPGQDNTGLIAAVFAFIVTITGFIMNFMKTEQTHQSVNSRMGELLKLTKKEGVEEGQGKDKDKEQL